MTYYRHRVTLDDILDRIDLHTLRSEVPFSDFSQTEMRRAFAILHNRDEPKGPFYHKAREMAFTLGRELFAAPWDGVCRKTSFCNGLCACGICPFETPITLTPFLEGDIVLPLFSEVSVGELLQLMAMCTFDPLTADQRSLLQAVGRQIPIFRKKREGLKRIALALDLVQPTVLAPPGLEERRVDPRIYEVMDLLQPVFTYLRLPGPVNGTDKPALLVSADAGVESRKMGVVPILTCGAVALYEPDNPALGELALAMAKVDNVDPDDVVVDPLDVVPDYCPMLKFIVRCLEKVDPSFERGMRWVDLPFDSCVDFHVWDARDSEFFRELGDSLPCDYRLFRRHRDDWRVFHDNRAIEASHYYLFDSGDRGGDYSYPDFYEGVFFCPKGRIDYPHLRATVGSPFPTIGFRSGLLNDTSWCRESRIVHAKAAKIASVCSKLVSVAFESGALTWAEVLAANLAPPSMVVPDSGESLGQVVAKNKVGETVVKWREGGVNYRPSWLSCDDQI